MNYLLVLSVVLPITFDVVLSESGVFDISMNMDCFLNLTTRAEDQTKRWEMYAINRNKRFPAFTAFMDDHHLRVQPMDKIVFPVVKININGYYDSITGIFKAHVTGSYFIQLVLTVRVVSDTNDEYSADLVTDNGNKVLGTLEFKAKDVIDRKNMYGLFDLNAGQEVWIRNGRLLAEYGGGKLSVFSGFLAEFR
ncbi:hypothetical protein CHS0354_017515 [Potamilus streckersoni]|uniref:C1q domain-containing protein n=1 Tax=Potamilus streckersoni TaxID=2493646 RepID=A0AAE0S7N8_9BIVA|nr:hypothetical protein CHS0354_017515 [Potamilus streckersoni]